MGKRSNAALLKKARPRTEPFTVYVDMGDGALDEYAALVAALQAIPAPPTEGTDKHKAARDKAGKAVVEANERLHDEQEFDGRLTVIPLLAWESLKAEHPPREGDDGDFMQGVDRSHAPAIIRPCALFDQSETDAEDWQPPTDEQWTDFENAVRSSGEWNRLLEQTVNLNDRAVGVPKLPNDFLRTLGRR